MGHAVFSFDGQDAIGGIFGFNLGVEPSACTLRMPIGSSLPKCGTLLLEDVGTSSISFPDCLLASHNYESQFLELRVLDRRWMWRGGSISMEFNIPVGGGPVINKLVSPQAIATALFAAMGEGDANVGELPNNVFPHVKWDTVEPKLALDALCRVLGCRPGLDPITNRARIYRLNTGAIPAEAFEMHIPNPMPAGFAPAFVDVLFGATIFQTRLKLQAVALNVDNDYAPLADNDQSAMRDAPTPWVGFPSLTGNEQERARRSAFHTYRITGTEGGLTIPGYGSISSVDDIVPILPGLTTSFLSKDGFPSGVNEPYVEGKFWSGEYCGVTHTDSTRYPLPFRIRPHSGLVDFEHAVFQTDTTGAPEPCDELYLVASHFIRNLDGLLVSEKASVATGVPCAGGSFPIRQLAWHRKINSVNGLDNQIDLQFFGQNLASVAAQQWTGAGTTAHRRQLGFHPVGVNGNVWQVVWATGSYVADRLATTSIGIRCEPLATNGTYDYKRNQSRAAMMADLGGI